MEKPKEHTLLSIAIIAAMAASIAWANDPRNPIVTARISAEQWLSATILQFLPPSSHGP